MTPFKITTQVTPTQHPKPHCTHPTQVRCAQIPRQHARSRPQRLTPAPRALPAPRRRARHRAKGACRVAEKAQLASSAKSKFFVRKGRRRRRVMAYGGGIRNPWLQGHHETLRSPRTEAPEPEPELAAQGDAIARLRAIEAEAAERLRAAERAAERAVERRAQAEREAGAVLARRRQQTEREAGLAMARRRDEADELAAAAAGAAAAAVAEQVWRGRGTRACHIVGRRRFRGTAAAAQPWDCTWLDRQWRSPGPGSPYRAAGVLSRGTRCSRASRRKRCTCRSLVRVRAQARRCHTPRTCRRPGWAWGRRDCSPASTNNSRRSAQRLDDRASEH